jgi:hypothetical protein
MHGFVVVGFSISTNCRMIRSVLMHSAGGNATIDFFVRLHIEPVNSTS